MESLSQLMMRICWMMLGMFVTREQGYPLVMAALSEVSPLTVSLLLT